MIDAAASNLSFVPLKFSRNKLSHTIEAADPSLSNRVGLKYYLSLFVPEFSFSSNFEELHTSEGREAPVSNEGGIQIFAGAEFRFNSGRNGKIDGLLSYLKPRWKQDKLGLSLVQTTSFYLKESIKGGVPVVNTVNELSKSYAIKAGLSNEDFYAHADTFWKTYQATKRQFLTWQPDHKIVGISQEEYLYFLINFTPMPSEVRLRVRYIYTDGTMSAPVTKLTLSNPLLCSVVSCPVGAGVLGVPTTAEQYEVWLSNENNYRFTETRSYLVDRTNHNAERSILFVNSLGGWDTLRLIGDGQRQLKVQQTVAEVERTANAPRDFSELKIINIEGEHELQVSTGYFRRDAAAQLNYLDELLLSEEVYLITSKGHKPMQLTTSNIVDMQDDVDLISRSFSFRILDTVENHSNLPAGAPVPERTTIWRGLNLKHVLDGYGKRTGKLAFERLEKIYQDDNTLVRPYTVKANVQGDPDYRAPITDSSIAVGSTPFPNALISRLGSFKRTNCDPNYLGGEATIVIAAGKYGGEAAGVADLLAEAEFTALNSQTYANENGTCTINNTPFHFAFHHKIAMDGTTLKVVGSADYGPVVNLRLSSEQIIPNSTGFSPSVVRQSDQTYSPGIYDVIVEVVYRSVPYRDCKIRIPQKNREFLVKNGGGLYAFEGLQINSSDEPLIFEVVNI